MAEAEVGDDVYGEDPTVRRLEEAFAERVGKEAALFVPSGTMANQIALRRARRRPGTAVLAGRTSHVARTRRASAGVQRAAQLRDARRRRRLARPDEVARWVAEAADPTGRRRRWCASRTPTCEAGGRRRGRSTALRAVAATGLPVHLDGARLFNAEVATGIPAAERAASRHHGRRLPVEGPRRAGRLACWPGRPTLVAEARVERQRLGGQHAPGRRARRRRPRGARRGSTAWPTTTRGPPASPRRWPSAGRARSTRRRCARTS